MKNYYDILGVNSNAPLGDIKRSFRKLAIMYHPDKNSSKEAEVIIKEIIEAYEVLSDPYLRSQYDLLLNPETQPVIVQGTRPHRDPRYRAKPRNPNYKSEKQLMHEMMVAYLPRAIFMSYCTAIFVFVLLIDFSLPRRHEVERINNVYAVSSQRVADEIVETDKGEKFKVSPNNISKLSHTIFITVSSTGMFGVPLYLTNNETHQEISLPATIFGNFAFAPIVLMITSLLGIFYRKFVSLTFNLGIVNAILLFLNLVFLILPYFVGR